MNRRTIITLVAVAAVAAGWYLFRPERLFINSMVNEQFPADSSVNADSASKLLFEGQFHDVAHKGVGIAAIHQLTNGRQVLRFTSFETSNGPDVRVYLVAAQDASDNDTVTRAGFLELGALKGNIGDQNYDVPEGTDLSKYKAVTIWCKRFGVNFATAPLTSRANS